MSWCHILISLSLTLSFFPPLSHTLFTCQPLLPSFSPWFTALFPSFSLILLSLYLFFAHSFSVSSFTFFLFVYVANAKFSLLKLLIYEPYYLCLSRFSGWGGICLTALIGFKNLARTRVPLLKGKAQYSWPPCSNPFRWAHSIKKILFTFLTKKLP